MNAAPQHLDPETLAGFAEGCLGGDRRDAVIAHLDHCDECMSDVATAMAVKPAARLARRSRWLIALAALVVLVVALPVLRLAMHPASPVRGLVAAAPRSARVVEPRLTGGFPWAEYHGSLRASDAAADSARLKLGGAAGELIDRAERDRSAAAQHAAGEALVLIEKPEEAVARLETAAKSSRDASIWSDLAAARYAAAVQLGRTSLLPLALAAADEALRIDAHLPEALFNRALILERLGLTSEARRAWERFLEADAGSRWAEEARQRMNALPATTGAARFDREQPMLEQAATAGNAHAVLALVDHHRERFRAFGEAEYLGRWAEAEQRHDEAEATRWLAVARSIGGALAQLSGESLLRDAVRAIDTAAPAARATLADAHTTYRRGRIAYSRHEREAAERDLRRAAGLFTAAGDPMALMARHYAASVRMARSDIAGARAELAQLRIDADAHPTYLALGGHVRWELARAIAFDEDWPSQAPVLTEAGDLFHRAGEPAAEATVESMLGSSLRILGRADDAWSALTRALHALSAERQSNLLESALGGMASMELQAGRPDAALALTRVAESLQGPGADPILTIETLLRRTRLESMNGADVDAAVTLRRAEAAASRLTDADTRARQIADVETARGAQLLARDPRAAEAALTRAIDFHRAHARLPNLPEPLLLRARCALRLGRPDAAQRDLEEGLQAMERHPVGVEGVRLGSTFDVRRDLFDEAVRLCLDRGDTAGAFAYAERERGGDAMTPDELRRRLAGSGTAVLEIVALPGELVTFAVSANDLLVTRRPRAAAELASLAARALSGDDRASEALYDDLMRPSDRVLTRAASLIVVPDAPLAGASFASLLDSTTHLYLIERVPVAIASSASSLQPASRGAAASMAAFALPAPDGAAALPEAESELTDVVRLYRRASAVPAEGATWSALVRAAASADVVHIAGHTERQPGDTGQALLFAGPEGTPAERVSWKTVLSRPPLHANVVVLAACETLRPARSSETRALSLGAAFAAGGADVVGTLQPIPDRDARALFRSFHRHLAAGAGAAAALRDAQLEAIHGNPGDARAWRALAVLTHHVR
jgi:tetratricopeptide (TPR) repeat protein